MNHQFLHLQGKVHTRYIKTQMGVLSGYRPHPDDLSKRIEYALITQDENILYVPDGEHVKADKVSSITYDNEVLEIYSELEDQLFRRLNRRYFEDGLLIPYGEQPLDINTDNEITNHELQSIAVLPNLLAFKKRVKPITSAVTLKRLLDLLEDRPRSYTNHIEERLKDAS